MHHPELRSQLTKKPMKLAMYGLQDTPISSPPLSRKQGHKPHTNQPGHHVTTAPLKELSGTSHCLGATQSGV